MTAVAGPSLRRRARFALRLLVAENCNACHNLPFDDGAGNASGNVHRDPLRGVSSRR